MKEQNNNNILENIIKSKNTKNILLPIYNNLAYVQVDLVDNKRCMVNLGDDYFLKTSFTKASAIIKKKKMTELGSINQLNDDTFEIIESVQEDDGTKSNNNCVNNANNQLKNNEKNNQVLNDLDKKPNGKEAKNEMKVVKMREKKEILKLLNEFKL